MLCASCAGPLGGLCQFCRGLRRQFFPPTNPLPPASFSPRRRGFMPGFLHASPLRRSVSSFVLPFALAACDAPPDPPVEISPRTVATNLCAGNTSSLPDPFVRVRLTLLDG